MDIKILEIRDEGTCIPVLCIRMQSDIPAQQYYLDRAGYPADGSSIMVMKVYNGKATNDPCEWPDTRLGCGVRTMPTAHMHILGHFDEFEDGDVVDVQYILKETNEIKLPEREEIRIRAGHAAQDCPF